MMGTRTRCPKCSTIQELGKSTACIVCGATIRQPDPGRANRPKPSPKPRTAKKKSQRTARSPGISRRTLILSIAGGVLALITVLIVFSVSAYRKATSLETRLEQLASQNESEVKTAKAAFEKAGTKGLPYLVRGLKGESDQSRKNCLELLKGLGPEAKTELRELRSGLADKSAQVQIGCATAIGYLGADGNEAESDLLKLLDANESAVRAAAFEAVAKVGSPERLVSFLIERLGKSDRNRQLEILDWLAQYGPKAKSAVRAILPLIDVKDREIQDKAFTAVGKIGNPDPQLMRKLAEILSDSQSNLQRIPAIRTLGGLGVNAVPLLIGILKFESQEYNSGNTALELEKIARSLQGQKLSKEQFVEILKKESERLSRANPPHIPNANSIKEAADSLGRIGPAAKEALPQLQASLAFCKKKASDYAGRTMRLSQGERAYGPNGLQRQSKDAFTMEIPLDRSWKESVNSIDTAISKIQ